MHTTHHQPDARATARCVQLRICAGTARPGRCGFHHPSRLGGGEPVAGAQASSHHRIVTRRTCRWRLAARRAHETRGCGRGMTYELRLSWGDRGVLCGCRGGPTASRPVIVAATQEDNDAARPGMRWACGAAEPTSILPGRHRCRGAAVHTHDRRAQGYTGTCDSPPALTLTLTPQARRVRRPVRALSPAQGKP